MMKNWNLKALSRDTGSFHTLVAVFAIACVTAYWVVREAVNRTIEHQALTVAEIVANQATSARTVYARSIAEKLRNDGFGPDVDSSEKPGHVPIPAQFLKLVGRASSESADKLYAYKPVSKWNLESTQGLADDFLVWAWAELEKQDRVAANGPLPWKAVHRFEESNGKRVLRYLSADPAAQNSCVSCHNEYERRPEVMAVRVAAGVPLGKQWQQHQLLGALSITLPLERAELIAGDEIRRTSVFVFGILISSFLALLWFNWRLTSKERSLRSTAMQLAQSELETHTARTLLEAKQGVEQALAELSNYLNAIDQHALVSVTDPQGRILQVNDRFVEISGYAREELLGQDHRVINSNTHAQGFFSQMWATIARGETWRGVICNRNKSGQLYWVDSTIVPFKNAASVIERYVSIRIDITERQIAEQEMLRIANHDSLTALPNRKLLTDRIGQALASARRAGSLAAVLFIDLDQFKAVNDSLGHDVGDLLLIEVARRLRSAIRDEDTVARQGGDEFIVLLPHIEVPMHAGVLAEKLLHSLSSTFHIGGRDLHIGASVGIAIYPDDGDDVETLLRNSDTAMYQVKAEGRNNYTFFAQRMNRLTVDTFSLGLDLRRALERKELSLHFQPIIDGVSGDVDALEVLLRWQHPTRGMVPPLEFVPLAESMGLILGIGEWVMRSACQQQAAWVALGFVVPRIAINLSAVQFQSKSLLPMIERILAETGVPATALELEITEGTLMAKSTEVIYTLNKLSLMGFKISIDDFGTGYSSLSYLKRFPIDTVKIDRSFVMDIAIDPSDAVIVKAIVAMAHSLGMGVVAEGVETQEQLTFLRAHGCERFQGYLFSRPVPASSVEPMLKHRV